MPYCSRCGVEVENYVEKCPLCSSLIQKFDDNNLPVTHFPQDENSAITGLKKTEKHPLYLAWMIFTILHFTPFFVVLTIAFQFKGLQTWAGYPLGALITAWLFTTMWLFLYKKPVVLSSGIFAAIASMLLYFDWYDGKFTWFLNLGLPLLVIFYILALAVALLSLHSKEKGLNIGGIILLASGVFCVSLDGFLSFYYTGKFNPTWSYITIAAFLPLAILFLLLHYVFKKKLMFKRFFHL